MPESLESPESPESPESWFGRLLLASTIQKTYDVLAMIRPFWKEIRQSVNPHYCTLLHITFSGLRG
jgi:hypothetical protein